jgi:amino acid transporter
MSLLSLILGRRLANREYAERQITALEGVPSMGLDGLSSASYGPEAALSVLIPLSAAGTLWLGAIMLPILVLLALLYISYRQTIRAYPSNGGAYTVAKENLGSNFGLLAAAALMIDYVLNVAVGISAGIGALTSALPSLHPYTLALCLVILAVVTIANLRGLPEASKAWAVPTYLFVVSLAAVIVIGVARAVTAGGHPQAVMAPPAPARATETVGLWLLLRAFAAGCTAMTGVEAVSNGVGAFREPAVKRAHHTLAVICGVLALLLAGIAYLVHAYGIMAMDQTRDGYRSVLSQLAAAVLGHGTFYDVVMGSVLSVLCLSANTSFVDFPRLCRLVARDDYLPRPFAIAGRRLVFSAGILYLSVAAGVLLVAFDGITDRLIPMFAIGAFLTFTLSQTGMVAHWRRELRAPAAPGQRHRRRVSLACNAVGAAATGVALVIIIIAKFVEGAWITLLVMPCVIVLLKAVKAYYLELDRRLRRKAPLDLRHSEPPIVLVATQGWNRLTDRALKFAVRLSPDVIAVHLVALAGPDQDERWQDLRRQWAEEVETPARNAGLHPPRLVLMEASYRRVEAPLLKFVEELEKAHRRRIIAVIIPEIVKEHWWQYLLHTSRGARLRHALVRYGGSRVVVTSIPWYLEEPEPEEGLEEEERKEGAGAISAGRSGRLPSFPAAG